VCETSGILLEVSALDESRAKVAIFGRGAFGCSEE
jgi:hypothetical protein